MWSVKDNNVIIQMTPISKYRKTNLVLDELRNLITSRSTEVMYSRLYIVHEFTSEGRTLLSFT